MTSALAQMIADAIDVVTPEPEPEYPAAPELDELYWDIDIYCYICMRATDHAGEH